MVKLDFLNSLNPPLAWFSMGGFFGTENEERRKRVWVCDLREFRLVLWGWGLYMGIWSKRVKISLIGYTKSQSHHLKTQEYLGHDPYKIPV